MFAIFESNGGIPIGLTCNENDSVSRATFLSDPSLCCYGAGIQETDISDSFSIYPNPTNNAFIISMNKFEKMNYIVFDITGKQVLNNNLYTSQTEVNTSALPEGLYICHIYSSDGKLKGSEKVSIIR